MPAGRAILGVARCDESRRLLRDQRRPADASSCLQPIDNRFTEGFGTADLIAAKQLLDGLSDAARQ